jgi:FkbM family methyltransferase
MKPDIKLDSIDAWIRHHIQRGTLLTKNTVFLDVGAYRGDVTRQMFLDSEIDKAILFEANKESYLALTNLFSNNKQVDIIHTAMGDQEGMIEFHCDSDPATGSVLSYQHSSDDLATIQRQSVSLTTIDRYCTEHPLSQRISVIKTDTQGFDLRVLKGAEKTLALHRPWLIVELIFVPLYENQSQHHEISAWLVEQDYTLAGMFNMHYTSDGWLAFADAVFVPNQVTTSFKAPFYTNTSQAQLESENTMLHRVCEERLELINRLHHEAAALREQLLAK